jgi:hypothetical protein
MNRWRGTLPMAASTSSLTIPLAFNCTTRLRRNPWCLKVSERIMVEVGKVSALAVPKVNLLLLPAFSA